MLHLETLVDATTVMHSWKPSVRANFRLSTRLGQVHFEKKREVERAAGQEGMDCAGEETSVGKTPEEGHVHRKLHSFREPEESEPCLLSEIVLPPSIIPRFISFILS